jgi:hypothetical protein
VSPELPPRRLDLLLRQRPTPIRVWHSARRHGVGGRVRASIIQPRVGGRPPWCATGPRPTVSPTSRNTQRLATSRAMCERRFTSPHAPAVALQSPDVSRAPAEPERAQAAVGYRGRWTSGGGQKARCGWCGAGLNNGLAAPNPTGRQRTTPRARGKG